MSEFLLVHGTGHGAWCFRDLIPALEACGHTARAIDLPAHGQDQTPIGDATLDSYAQAILGAIDTPVTLVGHSMGGFPITQAAWLAPEKVRRLIYLCAYVPAPGKSLVDMRRAWPEQPLADAFDTAPDRQSFSFKPALVREKLYQDCPPEVVDYARAQLCAEPAKPSLTPVGGTPDVPRSYIRCTKDQTIPPAYQTVMSEGCDERFDLSTGHSPFFADPAGLAALLARIA
ncbi:alpha/beta fold hydrolase [Aliiroseovarius subalbicans]|uniref:alpha/beta fold hydrolase n=1 Tax=Aliiroseovarius subalbicans TaxID=2925840 RepID=UPI001F584163|nr:alpha/beta fold hydrolase [Aliiroseovarius subalbicans]MCI2400259.1 alpha/beta fold hydrolase [Aliiroseovarius subalbicans]